MTIYDLLNTKLKECGMSNMLDDNMYIVNKFIDEKDLYKPINPDDKEIQNIINNILAFIVPPYKLDILFNELLNNINKVMLDTADAVESSKNPTIYFTTIEYLAMLITDFNILMLERIAFSNYKTGEKIPNGFKFGVTCAINRINSLRDCDTLSSNDRSKINNIILYYHETILNYLKDIIGEENKQQYKFICNPGNA